MPARYDALYLKEQWLQYQIKTLAHRGTMPFRTIENSLISVIKVPWKIERKMFEFYLHNLAFTDLNVWDPNSKLGDLQLMALASWMNHEEARATEMKKVMKIEDKKPLMIRVEQSNPMDVISTHNLIANDPKLSPRYLVAQEQAVTHFEDV